MYTVPSKEVSTWYTGTWATPKQLLPSWREQEKRVDELKRQLEASVNEQEQRMDLGQFLAAF